MQKQRSIFLFPLSMIYSLITAVRNFLYDSDILKSAEFSIPVICVGNLAVGGTGKTPHTEYLAGLLRKEFRVAVLSRGYRRRSKGFLIASDSHGVEDTGDEPLQMYHKFPDITIAVDRNRSNGITRIMKEKPETNVIILDDGFQHRRVNPGYSILLTPYDNLFINDHLLPYGNLREGKRNMRRADIILITKSPESLQAIQRRITVKEVNKYPYQNLYFTSITYGKPIPVFESGNTDEEVFSKEQINETGIIVLTGIAYPEPLVNYIREKAGEVVSLSFGDHHRFRDKDVIRITNAWNSLKSGRRYVITTEKDAVRLKEFTNIAEPIRSVFYYIPVGIKFLNDDQEEFDNLIIDYVRKNKRNNRIS